MHSISTRLTTSQLTGLLFQKLEQLLLSCEVMAETVVPQRTPNIGGSYMYMGLKLISLLVNVSQALQTCLYLQLICTSWIIIVSSIQCFYGCFCYFLSHQPLATACTLIRNQSGVKSCLRMHEIQPAVKGYHYFSYICC